MAGFALSVAILSASGCNDDPTTAVVDNDYPAAHVVTVYRAWWVTTLFPDPVGAGESSETERTIPASDFAYALIAPGWSPDTTSGPTQLIALKSRQPLSVTTHDLLHIAISDDTFAGDCAAGSTLSSDDASLIVERIFPGAFAGLSYDSATCVSTPVALDGGTTDAGDASAD